LGPQTHLGAKSQRTIQLVPKSQKMAVIILRRRRGSWEGVPVATWCTEWICRKRGGLGPHIFIIPTSLSFPPMRGAAVGCVTTILQNVLSNLQFCRELAEWQYTCFCRTIMEGVCCTCAGTLNPTLQARSPTRGAVLAQGPSTPRWKLAPQPAVPESQGWKSGSHSRDGTTTILQSKFSKMGCTILGIHISAGCTRWIFSTTRNILCTARMIRGNCLRGPKRGVSSSLKIIRCTQHYRPCFFIGRSPQTGRRNVGLLRQGPTGLRNNI